MQHCQGLRPDIAVVNIALMSQTWFPHAQNNYAPLLKFPGNLLVVDPNMTLPLSHHSLSKFTLHQLVSNILQDEPDRYLIFTSPIERWPVPPKGSSGVVELVPLGSALRVCLAHSRCVPLDISPAPPSCVDEPVHCSWPVGECKTRRSIVVLSPGVLVVLVFIQSCNTYIHTYIHCTDSTMCIHVKQCRFMGMVRSAETLETHKDKLGIRSDICHRPSTFRNRTFNENYA
jgi:hypothetical protein